jgi:hypothetical protein
MTNWQAKPNHRSTGWYVCSGNVELASVNQVLAGITAEECEANARLMAGAKELRTAAIAVVERWDTPNWKDAPATAEVIGVLRAAIAKATGETK